MVDSPGRGPHADQARRHSYLRPVLERIPALLSQIDREPHSRTFGSCDREQWGWKFRDFPLGMLQVAVYPLSMLWTIPSPDNVFYRSSRLLEWLDASIDRTLSRQRRNGAFDAFAPNEQDAGPTLGIVHGLCEAERWLGDALSEERRARIRSAVLHACRFALPRDETHGFISNHQALFANAYLSAAELTGSSECRGRSEEIIRQILLHQSPDGWYSEYGGPDPGYESLGVFHLAKYWQRTQSPGLLDSLRRSVDFYSHCVHPDGSVGGAYGSRHTRLYFPGGFEILSGEIPAAAAVAAFLRENLFRMNVVTAAQVDTENLVPLAYTYIEAALAQGSPPSTPPLPCHTFSGVRMFADSALTVAGTTHYYAVVSGRKGGLARVHARPSGDLCHEDAGYVVSSRHTLWASQLAPAGSRARLENDTIECSATLGEVVQELLTPWRFLLLRLLTLTLFRSARAASWFRRVIVARLITSRRSGPIVLHRTVHLEENNLRFEDRLELLSTVSVDHVDLPRSFTGIHMGSAKYFHSSDLVRAHESDLTWMAAVLNEKRTAAHSFTVAIPNRAPANPDIRPSAAPPEPVA